MAKDKVLRDDELIGIPAQVITLLGELSEVARIAGENGWIGDADRLHTQAKALLQRHHRAVTEHATSPKPRRPVGSLATRRMR